MRTVSLPIDSDSPWKALRKQNEKRLKDSIDASIWELITQGLEIEEEEFEEPQVIKDLNALILAIEDGKKDNYLMRTKNFKRLNLDKDKLAFWRNHLNKPEVQSVWAKAKGKIKNWLDGGEGDVASKEEIKKVSWCGSKKGKCCDGGDNNKCGKWVDDKNNKKCTCSYEGPCCSKSASKSVELKEFDKHIKKTLREFQKDCPKGMYFCKTDKICKPESQKMGEINSTGDMELNEVGFTTNYGEEVIKDLESFIEVVKGPISELRQQKSFSSEMPVIQKLYSLLSEGGELHGPTQELIDMLSELDDKPERGPIGFRFGGNY